MRALLLGVTKLPSDLMMLVLASIDSSLKRRLAAFAASFMTVANFCLSMKLRDRFLFLATGADLLGGVRIDLDREPFVMTVDKAKRLPLDPSL
jgi:hypothetical protein